MNNFTDNTNSELLTQLLDGELNASNEETLYAELGKSKELQEELRQQLLIRESIRKDTEAFTPPAAAVVGLFDKLGYAAPYAAMTGSSVIKATFWNSMFKRATVSLALLALLTFGGYNLIGVFDNDSETSISDDNNSITSVNEFSTIQSMPSNNQATDEKVSTDNAARNIPTINSYAVEDLRTQDIASSSVATSENTSNSDVIMQESNSSTNNSYVALVNQITTSNPGNFEYSINLSKNNSFNSMDFPKAEFPTPSNFKVYLKSLSGSPGDFHTPNIDGMFVNNMAFGLSLFKKGDLSGGIEIGQQSYSANITSDDDDNMLITKDMNVFWYTINVRYDLNDIEVFNIHPYGQLGAGSGNFGKYMIRYNVGLEMKPFDNGMSFMIGWEKSDLWYSTQNKSFKTGNGDIIFAISYSF